MHQKNRLLLNLVLEVLRYSAQGLSGVNSDGQINSDSDLVCFIF